MVGAKVIRRQTLVKYLDGKNFPPLRNLVANSGLEASSAPNAKPTCWNLEQIRNDLGTLISYVPSPLPGGGRALRLSWTAKNARDWVGLNSNDPLNVVQVEPLAQYILSTNLRGSLDCEARIYVQWLSATGTVLGTVTSDALRTTGQWQTLSWPARAHASAVYARVYAGRLFSDAPGGRALEIDNVQFERGAVVTEFQLTGTDLVASRNPTADPNEHFLDEIWFIERKVSETKEVVEFELTTAIDLNGEQLPGRQIISGVCGWLIRGGYRGPFCGYTGPAVADANDVPTTDPARDQCGGRVGSCKLRFGADKPLPYGGFPASGLLRT
ncbi:phage minor tail protein L [Stenotrophomonas maltophilia]|nr:phage minor tail protein L [Stenotrophomonas maltophilia]MBA0323742.1 phage minor tail protein L [Stenotrophomonas maltophilia]